MASFSQKWDERKVFSKDHVEVIKYHIAQVLHNNLIIAFCSRKNLARIKAYDTLLHVEKTWYCWSVDVHLLPSATPGVSRNDMTEHVLSQQHLRNFLYDGISEEIQGTSCCSLSL